MLGFGAGTKVAAWFLGESGIAGNAPKCHSLPPVGEVTRAGGVKCFVYAPAALAALHRYLLLMQIWRASKHQVPPTAIRS